MDLGCPLFVVFCFSNPAAISVCNTRGKKKKNLFNHFYLQYCYVLSLTGSLGMGLSCSVSSAFHPYPGPALHWKKNHHLILYQYLVQDPNVFKPMSEEERKRVRLKCMLRAAELGEISRGGVWCCGHSV